MNISEDIEKKLNEAYRHILAHHVSLGGPPENPNLLCPSPNGSGTFVKFSIKQNHMVYGILTAAHVARWLRFRRHNNRQFLALSKLQNGETVACLVTFQFIYHTAPWAEFHFNSNAAYRPDIAFIALGINDHLPNHELISDSLFYDLDGNQEFALSDSQIFSGFCKGAGNIRSDGLLNTFVAFGGGEILKFDEKAHIHYWQIPNTLRESVAGGSGAGFWRFFFEGNTLKKSLEGIVISESLNCDYFEAMETLYLYDSFLPSLKIFCGGNLSWFN